MAKYKKAPQLSDFSIDELKAAISFSRDYSATDKKREDIYIMTK